ncbi:hypothetical protein DXT99_12325 [Pontibacter diazotrophicus]|uniref:Uncharacterized protein n=1 Tax=Pontibacter diazotrophicus TaxID=1400979 RepID=A0A3D8LD64_9BACT|nr:hypothetical protein [Pontibacter diazotrophicus]RDV14882.1 hypothetical protein DXT99_12325 [Pontibacter diazotrophicus]
MAISIDNLRKGKKYRLKNYGEEFEFQVIEMPEDGEYKVKDLTTLDTYMLNELVKYGKGKDYDLDEL